MADTQTSAVYPIAYDEKRFITQLNPAQKEMVDELNKVKAHPLKIPARYVFPRYEEPFLIDALKYDQAICEANNLDLALIGRQVEHLWVFSVKYSTKIVENLVGDKITKCTVDAKGDDVFGYIFDTRNGYINMSHLEEKYNLNLAEWEAHNTAIINLYGKTLGFKYEELVIRGVYTYILPGLCTNFMDDVKPEYGKLLKTMSNLLVGLPIFT